MGEGVGITHKRNMPKVQVKLYLCPLNAAQFSARKEQEKFFTQHGLVIIKKRSKSNNKYTLQGTEFTNSNGEIFMTMCGMVVGKSRNLVREEFLCSEVDESAYLELFNKRVMPVEDRAGTEFYPKWVGKSVVIDMRLDNRTGKLYLS